MAKREISNKKREEIIQAAQRLFFANGYDATSIRGIMREAGGEVALFYYYFEGKDAVFNSVLESFFRMYTDKADRFLEKWTRSPFRMMSKFFCCMLEEAGRFRAAYHGKLHRSMVWALRDHVLTVLTPYVLTMLEVLVANGAKPVVEGDLAARFILYGVGNFLLREDEETAVSRKDELRKCVNVVLGLDEQAAGLMFPFEITSLRMSDCLYFYEQQKEHTPWLLKEDFINDVSLRMAERGVLAVETGEQRLAGLICFSRGKREITYFMVDAAYMEEQVFLCLLVSALAEFEAGAEVSVTAEEGGGMYRRLLEADFSPVCQPLAEGEGCRRMTVRAPK